MVSGLFRSLASRIRRPAAILKALNEALIARKVQARYVTMMLAHWSPEDRILRLSNSGGVPPLIVREGKVLDLSLEGVPIGLLPGREYDEVEVQLSPGDVVVFVSDGIPDQTDLHDEDFGRDRLAAVLVEHASATASEIADHILAEVENFAASATVFDDQTLIVLRVC